MVDSRKAIFLPILDHTLYAISYLLLTRIIHERFCSNRGFAAATSLDAVARHPGRRARRSVGQHTVGGLAPFFLGACPRLRSSGTGTAADVGASPLGSARLSRLATARFRDEPS